MKNINNAKPTILHMLLPAFNDRVNLEDEFLISVNIDPNESVIWFITELSETARSPISWFMFLNVANLLANPSSFLSFCLKYMYMKG